MALNRKCIVCPDKHHYKYCSNCSGYNSKETWRFLYCSENCKEIYNIATDFVSGKIEGLDAKKKLEKLDLSDLEFYHSVIKKNIQDILAFEEIIEIKSEVTVEEIVEENIETFVSQLTVETSEPIIESITTVASTSDEEIKISAKKRKNKKNYIVNVD